MNAKKVALAIALAVLFIGYPQQSNAKEFTSAELLSWPHEKQNGFFQISVTMAGFVAAQTQSNKSECIDSWYFKNEKLRNNQIRQILKQYPSHHPTGLVLASVIKACGKF